jgi:hypothetical protein
LKPPDAAVCPHCGAFAHQQPMQAYVTGALRIEDYWFTTCASCTRASVWKGGQLIYPGGGGPSPNPDLPEDIRDDYLEAQAIVGRSPRGAAALLRLCIQKLCKHFGEPGKNINNDIANLVKKGLPTTVQQAFDAVRVIGNEAVHPGQMDLRDDRQTAETLFKLVNLVVQRMISDPREVQEVYETLPPSVREVIEKRDRGKP